MKFILYLKCMLILLNYGFLIPDKVSEQCWYTKGIVDRCSSESSLRSVIHKVNTMLIFFAFEELFSSTVKIAL